MASWREKPIVFAFATLCAVTSSAALLGEDAAQRSLQSEEGRDGHQAWALIALAICGVSRSRRGVAGLRRAGEDAHEVVEERELLPDEQAVLVVHAASLGDEPLELGREVAGVLAVELRLERQHRVEVDLVGRDAELWRRPLDQVVPLLLELRRA